MIAVAPRQRMGHQGLAVTFTLMRRVGVGRLAQADHEAAGLKPIIPDEAGDEN